jgi:hypothetical protein
MPFFFLACPTLSTNPYVFIPMQQQTLNPNELPNPPVRQHFPGQTNNDALGETPGAQENASTEHRLHVATEIPTIAATQGSLPGRRKRQRSPTMSSQTGENTFYQKMQIRVRHSVGSMSISPSSRDIVLAG